MLDKQQQAIVESKDKNILVVAGAGSGKTRTLTERVRHLIRNGVEAHNIVCITFTNMASQEMKARLADVDTIGDAFIGTIHSFANTIYRNSGEEYQILTDEVKMSVYRELLTRGIYRKCKYEHLTFPRFLEYMDLITLYDEGKVSEEEVNAFLLPSEKIDLKDVTNEMYTVCKERHYITFDELLHDTKVYYETIGGTIEYLLVDEFQDVGRLEANFVMALNADNLFLVGDDWQAIYGFKGGDVKIFLRIIEDPDFTVYYLENNYRNKESIINLGNTVIKQVPDRIPKAISVMNKENGGGKVIQGTMKNVVQYLKEIKEEGNFRDWFILTRTNKEIVELSGLLEDLDIPFMSFKRAGMTFDAMTELMAEDTVKLLTVHVSKGLENKNVILYGKFPVKQPNYLRNADERKVMYVGVTRAEEKLILLN